MSLAELHAEKGKMDGRCNRRACQKPLADEPVRCSMTDHETFVEGKRLYYCMRCADAFDDADRGSPLGNRITRELKATPGAQAEGRSPGLNHAPTEGGERG